MPSKELTFRNGTEELVCEIEWSDSGELLIDWFNPYTGYTASGSAEAAAIGMKTTPALKELISACDSDEQWQRLCDLLITWDDSNDQTFELIDGQFHSI
jgi:hypothetical protein